MSTAILVAFPSILRQAALAMAGKRKPAAPVINGKSHALPQPTRIVETTPDHLSFWSVAALLLAFLILGAFVLALIYGLPFQK